MEYDFTAFAVPFFLFFMLIEYCYSSYKKIRVYSLNESIINVNVGILERLSTVLVIGYLYLYYNWLHLNFSILEIRPLFFNWVILFLITDFVFYWYHRFGHTVNILWGAHVVHHQSEDFNYTVGVRVTIIQTFFRGICWSVLPIIGFPAGMIMFIQLVHGTYPFFSHSRLVGKLGFLEYILVTPSHHRVHHASNERYIDKNYGNVFIVWDKLFGTFKEEDELPKYGIETPIKSNSILWLHFHFYLEMLLSLKNTDGWKNRLRIVFGSPNIINKKNRLILERRILSTDRHNIVSDFILNSAAAQTVFTLVSLFIILLIHNSMDEFQLYICSMFMLVTTIHTGAILEQKKWVYYLDLIRLCFLSLFLYHSFNQILILYLFSFFLLLLLIFNKYVHNKYYAYLYQ